MRHVPDRVLRPVPLPVPRPDRWHRPLLIVAAAMVPLAVAMAMLSILDPQQITGTNGWFKPLKFALSIGVYAITLAWLLGQVRRWRRVAELAGTLTAIGLLIEIVIIVAAAAAGTTSHFNLSTPLHAALWTTMGASIVAVWMMSLVVGVAVAVNPGPDRARNLAVRAGVTLGVIGMALAFLMTGPTPDQQADFQGIAGAHAVGVADGGPGLPFLGWSTIGGDLRVPHFLGLHALQALPLLVLGLEWLGRRYRLLSQDVTRWQMMAVASGGYAGLLGLLTWQAMAGQSVLAPRGAVLVAGLGLTTALALAVAAVLLAARRRSERPFAPHAGRRSRHAAR